MNTPSQPPTKLEYTGQAIDAEGLPRNSATSPASDSSSSSLVTAKDTFSNFLAPLNKETFQQVVIDIEDKLKVVNQELGLLDNIIDSDGFDAILNEMLRSITLKTGELLGADRTIIYLLDEEQDQLWSIVAKDEDGKPIEIRISVGQGIVGEVAQSKKVINIPFDFYDDPRSESAQKFDKLNNYRTYSMLALPLLKKTEAGDELVAVVQLINKLEPNVSRDIPLDERISHAGFTDTDLEVFENFAPSIRLILESSRSFYKATQRQRAANALIEATNSLSRGNLDLDATLRTVMDAAKKLMNADRSTLWLIDHDKNDIWTKIPLPNGEVKEFRVPVGVGFAGQVAQTGEILNIGFDLYKNPDAETAKNTDKKTGYRTCSLLCMPVFNSDKELIGVTQLINKIRQGDHSPDNSENWPEAPECWKASFNRNDQEFMEAFNIQAGVALQNAKLFAKVRQQEQMQRDILRSLTNGVISTDKHGYILAANEKAKALLGVGDKTIEGLLMKDLIAIKNSDDDVQTDQDEGFTDWFQKSLNPEDTQEREQYYPDQTIVSADGEERSINLSIHSITDDRDLMNAYGSLVVMDDISDEKRLKSTMYRYMNQELAEQLLEGGDIGLGGDRKEVSVLFSDIRSYASLTDKLSAEKVVETLNTYFESMVESIFEHKGILDKYIGDAIMAVFGTPFPLPDHALKACQCALDMRRRLAVYNADRADRGEQTIRIGIGINSDFVISGNIGSSKRMEFTAIGDGVDLSACLKEMSKQYGCDIVISENTYHQCEGQVLVRELDRIRVKGARQPVEIYELIEEAKNGYPEGKEQIIELYNKAHNLYTHRDFAKAICTFGTILELNPNDKASWLHIDRCQQLLKNPPKPDWDGVWTITSK